MIERWNNGKLDYFFNLEIHWIEQKERKKDIWLALVWYDFSYISFYPTFYFSMNFSFYFFVMDDLLSFFFYGFIIF